MRRRRGCLFMALGLVLAVATGALVFHLLQQAGPGTASLAAAQALPTPTPLPTKSVPVAARQLAVGATLTTTDIIQRAYPENLVPVGVLTDSAKLAGQVLVEQIDKGEFFQSSQFRGGAEKPLSDELAPKKIAMAFSREDLLNKSSVIQEGDHVDLMLTIDIKEETTAFTREGKATSYTLQNIKVLRIVRAKPTEQDPNPQATSIVFELNPQDAVIAKFVKDSGGTVDFTLRSSKDTKPFETEAINQDYIFDHYGLKAPVSSTKPKDNNK